MSSFTAEMAFEQSEAGEPILLDGARVAEIVREHGAEPCEYWEEMERAGADPYDSAVLLGWLGY
jgi:hypothetical protein